MATPPTSISDPGANPRGPAPGRVDLHLRIRVRPGRRAEFLDFLREAIPYYESPGGIEVRLLQDRADDHRFIELVQYDSESGYAKDQARVEHDPTMRSLLVRWRELLAEPPVVEVYHLLGPGSYRQAT